MRKVIKPLKEALAPQRMVFQVNDGKTVECRVLIIDGHPMLDIRAQGQLIIVPQGTAAVRVVVGS